MSQHDFDISAADANTGSAMRTAINAALQALAGNSSGLNAPATSYPYQFWPDETTGLFKQRNAGNSAWITIRKLDGSQYQHGDGSAAAPGISFAGDTDTGLYRIGANNIGLAVGGTKILDISSTGLKANVASPTQVPTLGVGSGDAIFLIDNVYGLLMGTNSAGTSWLQSQRVDNSAIAYPISLNPSGGSVLIGTSTVVTGAQLEMIGGLSATYPVASDGSSNTIFDLRHTASFGMRIDQVWNTLIDYRFIVRSSGADNNSLTLKGDGNVLIGSATTVTGAKLEVTGSISSTGAITTNGGLQTFGANDSAGAGYRVVRVPNA